MATLTVRQATPDDATELARMLDLFDSMRATPEQVAARMLACQSVLTTFIGEIDGQPVGFACLRLIPHLQGDEPYAELTDIYVDAPYPLSPISQPLLLKAHQPIRRSNHCLSVPAMPCLLRCRLSSCQEPSWRSSGTARLCVS